MFDVKCFELAKEFISDHPELEGRENDLAQHIQDSIEDWIAEPYIIKNNDPWNLRKMFENFI